MSEDLYIKPDYEGVWNGKPAYAGVADIDGHILQAVSYAQAKPPGRHGDAGTIEKQLGIRTSTGLPEARDLIEAVFGEPSNLFRAPEKGDEWLVAAAIRNDQGDIYLGDFHGTRHDAEVMDKDWEGCVQTALDAGMPLEDVEDEKYDCGFYTNRGRFVNRQEALDIIRTTRQNRRPIGKQPRGELDSETVHRPRRPDFFYNFGAAVEGDSTRKRIDALFEMADPKDSLKGLTFYHGVFSELTARAIVRMVEHTTLQCYDPNHR